MKHYLFNKSPATKSSHAKLGDYVHHVDGLCVFTLKKVKTICNNSNKPTELELGNRKQGGGIPPIFRLVGKIAKTGY